MKNQIYIDRGTLELLYYNNKQYIIPLITIVVCILLFFQLIIPQFQDIFQTWEQEKQIQKDIEMYKNNLVVLGKISSTTVDNQLRIISSILPPNKDFEGILASIAYAESKSQAKVGDYSLSVGKLDDDQSATKGLETNLTVNLSVSGSISAVRSFIKTLSLSGPVADVSSVSYKGDLSAVKVAFYYKPFPLITIDYKKGMTDLSSKEKEKIQEISNWNNVVKTAGDPFGFLNLNATGSGTVSP